MSNQDDLLVVKTTVLAIREDVLEIKTVLQRFEERLRILEMDNAANKVRTGIFSAIAAGFGILAAAVAAWLGTR